MKNKYLIAFNLGAILFLAAQSGWAQVSCQSDGSGGITCINNCTQPIQSNANVQLTTNDATRDSIQKLFTISSPLIIKVQMGYQPYQTRETYRLNYHALFP